MLRSGSERRVSGSLADHQETLPRSERDDRLGSGLALEVLGGWKDARALLTFGTPYRGSLNALNTLANGERKAAGRIDLSPLVRSLTALELLVREPAERVLHELLHVVARVSADRALAVRHQRNERDRLGGH